MANDPPTNLRMGFGYQQARAAGAPYSRPSTASEMDFKLKEKAAETEIRAILERHPKFEPLVRKIINNQVNKNSSQEILFILKCEIASRSKAGFVVTGRDGKTYESKKVKDIYTDGLCIEHEGRRFMLYIHYIKDISVNDVSWK